MVAPSCCLLFCILFTTAFLTPAKIPRRLLIVFHIVGMLALIHLISLLHRRHPIRQLRAFPSTHYVFVSHFWFRHLTQLDMSITPLPLRFCTFHEHKNTAVLPFHCFSASVFDSSLIVVPRLEILKSFPPCSVPIFSTTSFFMIP